MFKDYKLVIQQQFNRMKKHKLFRVNVDKDVLWDTYLNSFKPEDNPIFRERTEHDCQSCKRFIQAIGNTVAIINGKIESVWDVKSPDEIYQPVTDALSALIKSLPIDNVFLHIEATAGLDKNFDNTEDGEEVKVWHHFFAEIPREYQIDGDAKGGKLSETKSTRDVFFRSLNEITIESMDTVLDLIKQNSLHRGTENKPAIVSFKKQKEKFDAFGDDDDLAKELFCWTQFSEVSGSVAKIRNTAIGTLLIHLSEGKDLDFAVRSFEDKVSGGNYKRPNPVVTEAMAKQAKKSITDKGYIDSLPRRYAVTEDITLPNVLFADRRAKAQMDVFDEIIKEIPGKQQKLDKIEEITIEDFIKNILPTSETIEILLQNEHESNMVSLIAPVNLGSKGMFQWHNNFSWTYNGEVADSMKQRVKKAGGNVEGVIRFSIEWNDDGDDPNDLDAHCTEPNDNLIYFGNKAPHVHPSSGVLDVDIQNPGTEIAVENITWSDIQKMLEGRYHFEVHNFSHRGGRKGFKAEIEYNGTIYSYVYNKNVKQDEKVTVALIDFNKKTGIKFIKSLPSTESTRKFWNIETQKFQNVSMVMYSPNYWDERGSGHKHYFFMLEECLNPGSPRGFFNEFLNEELSKERKAFEVIGGKMRAAESDNQLSGVGFSSTRRNSVLCRVKGSFTRTIKINF